MMDIRIFSSHKNFGNHLDGNHKHCSESINIDSCIHKAFDHKHYFLWRKNQKHSAFQWKMLISLLVALISLRLCESETLREKASQHWEECPCLEEVIVFKTTTAIKVENCWAFCMQESSCFAFYHNVSHKIIHFWYTFADRKQGIMLCTSFFSNLTCSGKNIRKIQGKRRTVFP